jgi:ABC-type uncharacterized transport system substrate-binding protein
MKANNDPLSTHLISNRLKAASADIYYKANQTAKGDQFLTEVGDDAYALINYYKQFTQVDNKNENIQILQNIGPLARAYKRDELATKYDDLFKQVSALY